MRTCLLKSVSVEEKAVQVHLEGVDAKDKTV